VPAGFFDSREQHTLPHPAVALSVLLVVETALCVAWELLRNHPREGFSLGAADEDAITLELNEALFDRVFDKGIVNGFDKKLFSTVEREPKIRNYNYEHPDKMPDLVFRLVGRPAGIRNTQDGLFVECKPVDSNHGVQAEYCNKGLIRFVRGDYAWAMPNAMMVGYAKEGYTIPAKLIPALQNWEHGVVKENRYVRHGQSKRDSHSTRHARTFEYQETKKAAPEITIRHLWLRRD
jgi:hypothetical protein